MTPTVIVFLKAPRIGTVKTRLAREVGEQVATGIYRTLAEAQCQRIPSRWHAEVHFAPADAEPEMRTWLGGRTVFRAQSEGDLGAKLTAGFAEVFRSGRSPVIAIGGDCPDLDEVCLEEASLALRDVDVVLGPAADGGYYLIGLNEPHPEMFVNIPWSSPEVLSVTRARASTSRLRYRLLQEKSDVDDRASWAMHQSRQAFAPVRQHQ